MTNELAENLLAARSAKAFLRTRSRAVGWQEFAALKVAVDQLIHRDLHQASRLAERIEQLAELAEMPLATSFAQASRARVLHVSGQPARANELYETSILALRRARLPREAATVQKQQVDALMHLGRYEEALAVARAARRVLKRTDPLQLAQLEVNTGNVYYMLDRYQKALDHYNLARPLFARRGDATMRAVVDFSRANIFTELDRPDEAMKLLERAVATYEKAGKTLYAAQSRYHIAYIQFLKGNYNVALTSYYELREQLSQLGSAPLVAWCDLEIAEILLALNAFADAFESATSARRRFAAMEMQYEFAKASVMCAMAAIGLRQYEQAEGDLRAARVVFAAQQNTIFVAVVDSYQAELALRRGDAARARPFAQAALRVFTRRHLSSKSAQARLLLARAHYQAGDNSNAARQARAALRSGRQPWAPSVTYQAHHLLGKIARDRRRPHAALEHFRLAVKLIEQMRGAVAADEFKATFLRDKMELYEDAICVCLDVGATHLEEAFRLVESSKSRALAELLARYLRGAPRKVSRASQAEQRSRARLLQWLEQLNWYSAQSQREDEKGGQRRAPVAEKYERERQRCERHIAHLFRRLEAAGSAFVDVEQPPVVKLTDLRDALDTDETLIEYFTLGDQVSAFVASRADVQIVRGLASKQEVERRLAALRFQLEKFNYGADFADGHFEQLHSAMNQYLIELYQLIFAALEPLVNQHKLILIPHGALHYVPFHALLNRHGYLLDRFAISYAPSATILKLCRDRSRTQTFRAPIQMVALGLGDRETPSIEAEICALENLFPDSVTLTGDQATRANFLAVAPRAQLLHLASHSYFRRDNPMFSYLQLADSPLNFYNLMDVRLQAELVTLSACHTGMNQVFPGDELHGLMRGFLYAGAPSLVASLWAANDLSTAEFMREMYARIRAGDSKRDAIRAAQQAIKDAYGHPYYWAPFVLMGNPN